VQVPLGSRHLPRLAAPGRPAERVQTLVRIDRYYSVY